MSWYYHLGGQQLGPVSDAELANLLQTGRITRNTPVWREGMVDWQPLSVAQSGVPPLLPMAPGSAPCAECGRAFPADELITLNHSLVCAHCKPLALQRMAEGVPSAGRTGLWRERNKLVTRAETPFPDRCVKCNAPANGIKLKRVLYWQHPGYYALLLLFCVLSIIGLLIFLIVSLIVRKKAVLHIGLCEAHRNQRTLGTIICTTGMVGGLALLAGSMFVKSGWMAVAGGGAFLFGIIWGIWKARMIAATKIENDMVWVSGVGPAFLSELPER